MPQQANSSASEWTPVDEDAAKWTPVTPRSDVTSSVRSTISNVTGPDSMLGGFARRGVAAVKGLAGLAAPPEGTAETAIGLAGGPGALPLYRAAKGVFQGGAQAGEQAAGQAKEAVKTAVGGNLPEAALRGGQALTTAASIFNPLATSAVTNINTLEGQNRHREAIGSGTFDALAMLAGRKAGVNTAPERTINKLAYATEAKSIRPLTHLLPDIEETVRQNGKPQTVGQLYDTIQKTSDRLEQQFNTSLQQMGEQPIHTQAIADALKAKADSLPRAAEMEANALRMESKLYDGTMTTARELNADRMYRADNLQNFYNKSLTGQMAAARSGAQTMADKIVYDGSRNLLYDEMDKRFPGQDFQELKRKQSSVLDMIGDFKDHVEKLEAAQAKRAGAPLSEKAQVSASAHPGGSVITPRFHGLMNLLPGGGPLVRANKAAAAAFSPSAITPARRAAILALPVTSLVTKRLPAIQPPPQSGEGEQGIQ